jgi:cytosine/adenosine deaminase-related metal-dependent hydrolase
MILKGARGALSATESAALDIGVAAGRITFRPRHGSALDLRGYLVLPGLINAHDHLEFSLFPRLGRGPYRNATAWAEDIYRPEQPPIAQQLRIPKSVRLFWGGLRNLLAGVTCVMHHNPYEPSFDRAFPVRVVRRFGWAHSLRFTPAVASSFAASPPDAPFILHACEGTDADAEGELRTIDAAGALGPATAIVHGVALRAEGISLMRARQAGLIWCPTSNAFTLGRTVSPEVMDSGLPIALGTDSSLTAEGDMIDELRAAAGRLGAVRAYEMVTQAPARILRLGPGAGRIQEGGIADLLVVRNPGPWPADALHALNPELVIIGGRIKLCTPAIADRLGLQRLRLQPVHIEGRGLRYVACDVRSLAPPATGILGDRFRLAGKRVTV